ncbi:MAG: YbaN family protein [Ectothiorhodospiraceae bacterium]|nr:YbaN family protein [Ectothiorhodospiraceae bacterium]
MRTASYLVLGWVCVALGVIGAFLPVMPTTVFLLVAAWAFARSSPRWHRWLREHPRFGAVIRGWEEHRAMPRRAKRIALTTLAGSYAVTATWLGPFSTGALLGGAAIVGVALYILYLPVLPTE